MARKTGRYTLKGTVYRFSIEEVKKYGRFIYKEEMSVLNHTTCDDNNNNKSISLSSELEINLNGNISNKC